MPVLERALRAQAARRIREHPPAEDRPGRALAGRLGEVADRLASAYGRPRPRREEPVDALVHTILSQNTSDVNSERAFRALKAAFPSWNAVAEAKPRRIERAIRQGGLARVKSRSIHGALLELRRREGSLRLAGLCGAGAARAAERLRGLPGVGPKTRACVLLFCCGYDAFPVDTHVRRVAERLGLVPVRSTAERAQVRLEAAVPRGRALDLHLNLVRLGRERCRPRSPRCPGCPLEAICQHAARGAC
jgi:endonuclease-3